MTQTITIPANVVPYLRSGLVAEFGSALDLLVIQHEREPIAPVDWNEALQCMASVRPLLDVIGVAAPEVEADVELDLVEQPLLVLHALIAVHRVEVMRVQDAATDGVRLSHQDMAALTSLVDEVEQAVDPSGAVRQESASRMVDWAPKPVRRQATTGHPINPSTNG
jgi:hypothetical protein